MLFRVVLVLHQEGSELFVQLAGVSIPDAQKWWLSSKDATCALTSSSSSSRKETTLPPLISSTGSLALSPYGPKRGASSREMLPTAKRKLVSDRESVADIRYRVVSVVDANLPSHFEGMLLAHFST